MKTFCRPAFWCTAALALFVACSSPSQNPDGGEADGGRSGVQAPAKTGTAAQPADSLPARHSTRQQPERPASTQGGTSATTGISNTSGQTRNNEPEQTGGQARQDMPGAAKLSPARAKAIIEQRALEVVNLMDKKDFYALAGYIHPTKGVRFSPYSYVRPNEDVLLDAHGFTDATLNGKAMLWGHYDGSGEPIKLTFKDYYDKFVYDHDYYRQSQKVGYNEVVGKGNSLVNRAEVYPDAVFAEYYKTNPQNEMDWSSLTLAFEKYGSQWYLTGIIHNGWTI